MLAYLISALKHLSLSKCFRWRPKSKVKGVRMRITLLTSAEIDCHYLSNCRPLVALASWFWFRKRPKLSKLMLFGKWHSQPLILIRHKQFSSFQSLSKDDSSLYYFRKSMMHMLMQNTHRSPIWPDGILPNNKICCYHLYVATLLNKNQLNSRQSTLPLPSVLEDCFELIKST